MGAFGGPAEIRTQDNHIKSVGLYLLSYETKVELAVGVEPTTY